MDAGKVAIGAGTGAVGLGVLNEAVNGPGTVTNVANGIGEFAGTVATSAGEIAGTVATTTGKILESAKDMVGLNDNDLGEMAKAIGLDDWGDLVLGGFGGIITLAFLLGKGTEDKIKKLGKSVMIGSILAGSLPIFGAGLTAWATKHFYDGLTEAKQ